MRLWTWTRRWKTFTRPVAAAEDSAGVEIHNVFASVSGGHIRCFNNRGSVIVTNEDREITDDEVRNVLLNAKAVNIPMDHVVVHAIGNGFMWMVPTASRIQSDAWLEIGSGRACDSRGADAVSKHDPLHQTGALDVQNIAVSSFASALAVLTTDQQKHGAVVIDMGGGTTDYIVYRDGTIQHSGVLAVGGDHLTNDIAIGLRIPMNRAEQLKLEHGSVEVRRWMKPSASNARWACRICRFPNNSSAGS